MATICPTPSTVQEDASWFHLDVTEYFQEMPSTKIEELTTEVWKGLFTKRQHGLVQTRTYVLETVQAEEGDDVAQVETAVRANQLLGLAYGHMPEHFFPVGHVSVTPNADIRIEWRQRTRHVRLFIPADPIGAGYIYHQEGETFGTVSPTPEALAGMLIWLLDA